MNSDSDGLTDLEELEWGTDILLSDTDKDGFDDGVEVAFGSNPLLDSSLPDRSIARLWNEQNLEAIRLCFPDPPVHAWNLFHNSVAMWDAWAAYDETAVGYLYHEAATASEIEAARTEAISYAAYRVLSRRYQTYKHPITPQENADLSQASFDRLMRYLGYDITNTATEGDSPASLGNRVASLVISWGEGDGSNELNGYQDETYAPVNVTLDLRQSGTNLASPNRWQPLEFVTRVSQNGQILESTVQEFIGSNWGETRPFALSRQTDETVYYDPGAPPQLGWIGDADYKAGNVEVIRFSSLLDPDANTMIDISPGTYGDNPLGTNEGAGHSVNPVTGEPYAPNLVNHGDFGRVMAEFWADGPNSETPPGHWNRLANEVVDHPNFERRFMGQGPELDVLEWDVKMYFLLNASVHDAAVAAWGCKRKYDYVRPISSIRYMAGLGQSTDVDGPAYHPSGIPLVADLIEVVTAQSSAGGERHSHLASSVGEIAIFAWGGEPQHPETEYTGAQWILAKDWLPYQRDTFVTPAFAGYVSGHSCFSRASAEVLTRLTGSAYFPGGMASHRVPAGGLEFEAGPSADIVLQWATYYDAADQAGISRLYGGIHVPVDDGPGRIIGSSCGIGAWDLGIKYFDGSILTEPLDLQISSLGSGEVQLDWKQRRGLLYSIQSSPSLEGFAEPLTSWRAETDRSSMTVTKDQLIKFFRLIHFSTD